MLIELIELIELIKLIILITPLRQKDPKKQKFEPKSGARGRCFKRSICPVPSVSTRLDPIRPDSIRFDLIQTLPFDLIYRE